MRLEFLERCAVEDIGRGSGRSKVRTHEPSAVNVREMFMAEVEIEDQSRRTERSETSPPESRGVADFGDAGSRGEPSPGFGRPSGPQSRHAGLLGLGS